MSCFRISLLLVLLSLLVSCEHPSAPDSTPLNLVSLLDDAELSGAAARSGESMPEQWTTVLSDTFEEGLSPQWQAAPGFRIPLSSNSDKEWSRLRKPLLAAGHSQPAALGREGRALKITGPLGGDWNGFIRSLPVRAGRRYRISFWVRGESLTTANPADLGFVAMLELRGQQSTLAGFDVTRLGSRLLNRQESAGTNGRFAWHRESFTFAAREETESLLLALGVSRHGGLSGGTVWFDDLLVEEEQIGDLADFITGHYQTPRSSMVRQRRSLFRAVDWGSPLELSRLQEGIVVPGDGRLDFKIPAGHWGSFDFSYGPLKEFSGLRRGRLEFYVKADGKQIFRKKIDFARDEGRRGWQRATVKLPEGIRTLSLETVAHDCSEPVAAIWGVPTLLPAAPASTPHQTLVICVDSLRRDAVGAYGGPDGVTPNIDALAQSGTRFENYFSAGNTTSYALTSFFTGRYVGKIGLHRKTVYDLLSQDYKKFFLQNVDVFPALLRDHGVATFSAMDNPFFLPGATGVHVGFQEVANYGGSTENYSASTGHVLDFVDRHENQDFFAFIHYDPDHLVGYVPAADDESGTQLRQRYHDEVHKIDIEIGRLLTTLAEKGLDRNLTVVLFADHGENMDPRYPGHGNFLTDDQIRVPLIVRTGSDGLAKVEPGQVSSVDLAPWLLKRYGLVPIPKGDGDAGALSRRRHQRRILFSEGIYQHRLSLLSDTAHYLLTFQGEELFLPLPGAPAVTKADRTKLQDRAEQFLVNTLAGLYLRLPAGFAGRLDLRGLKTWPIGLGLNGRGWQDAGGIHLQVPAGEARYLFFFPFEEMQFPAQLQIVGSQGEVAVGQPDSFLPVSSGRFRWNSVDALDALTFAGHPMADAGAGDIPLLWLSPGTGTGAMISDATRLDVNVQALLRRWGYLK